MNIQSNKNADKPPVIYIEEIQYYAKQLAALVKSYKDNILIRTDEQVKVLEELQYYADQLLSGNYDAVISNSRELIVYNEPNQSKVPWED